MKRIIGVILFIVLVCLAYNYRNNIYEFYYNVLRRVELLPGDIYIHRNVFNGEKDFGVPKERIIDSVRVIKDAQVF